MEFGKLMQSIRIQHYFTQREFSDFTGIPLSTLKQWEKGKYLPSLSNFKKLLQFKQFNKATKERLKLAYERDKIECMNNL